MIAAKTVFALVGAAIIVGTILLANADAQSVSGIMKGVIGLGLCVLAVIGGRAFYKSL